MLEGWKRLRKRLGRKLRRTLVRLRGAWRGLSVPGRGPARNARNEELLDAIWEALNVARDNKALVVARQGAIININARASQLCGRSRDELIGKSVFPELFEGPPELHPAPSIQRWETALKTASGNPIAVEVTRQPLGTRLHAIEAYALRDLRERHVAAEERERQNRALQQREEELTAQNVKFDAALENMLQGLAMFDAEQRLIVCNRRYAEMYGLTPDQVKPGTTVREIFEYRLANGHYHIKDSETFVDSWTSKFGEVSSRIQELADGRIICVSRHQMANGGRLVTHEDITEREKLNARLAEQNELLKLREQELQAHEERLRTQNLQLDAALNNMSQGLCMMDAEQRLVICNRRYAEMYGLPPALMQPGTPMIEILEDRIARGLYAGGTPDEYRRERQEVGNANAPSTRIQELSDGRVVVVVHQPMPGGGAVATHEDITEQRRIEARMAHMAHHDALTGLPNRVLLHQRLEQAVKLRQGVGVLCLDLDRFKEVNDTLGHAIGDVLLKAVAERLRSCTRETDTLARSSGDEFVIVQIAAKPSNDAAVLAARIQEAIGRPFDLDGHQVVVGTSIGIAVSPNDGTDPYDLLKHADLALYRSKSRGRGVFCFFEQEMNTRMQARRDLERDLRTALGNREFELHYQPIVNIERNEASGFEALLRWYHPERGIVSPGEFIPLAEETGLIVPIGEWVLRQACADAASWPRDLRVAVNLSAVQFKNRALAQTVFNALAMSGLAASRLELEITESVLLQDSEATLATLHQLRDLGVRIALDDFGTGYSSLSYLRSFPFDKIKIDRCFVADLSESDADSLAIVRAVARLGDALGMSTTAEGVETKEQLECVRTEGCTEIQGYLFSAPKRADEITEYFVGAEEMTSAA
jgi:diguanylate cyclase (GGDEF)-like protein